MKNTGKNTNAQIGVPIKYDKLIIKNCVPFEYISAGKPSNVIADAKLAVNENDTGSMVISLLPSKYSAFVCWRPPLRL